MPDKSFVVFAALPTMLPTSTPLPTPTHKPIYFFSAKLPIFFSELSRCPCSSVGQNRSITVMRLTAPEADSLNYKVLAKKTGRKS